MININQKNADTKNIHSDNLQHLEQLKDITKKVDAQHLDVDELLQLFEPNEDLSGGTEGAIRLSSYDRVADPNRTYYLVAERGVGKTHILRLLQCQLETYGHSVLTIELEHSEIMTSYRRLREKYPTVSSSSIWQLAILEEILIDLFDSYLSISFIPSLTYKLFKWTVTKNLLKKHDNFFKYVKDYRSDVWDDYQMILGIGTIPWLFIPRVKISLPIIGDISFEFDKSSFVRLDKKAHEDELEIGTRIKILSASIWATLNSRRKGKTLPYVENPTILTRSIPSYKGVYVIADGLDQTENSLKHDDLLGLISAVKTLNKEASQNIGNYPNFKAVIAIRSVTFDYIMPKIPDLEQIRPHIERLTWNKDSLRRFMARRILSLKSDKPLPKGQVNKILEERFVGPIHYFGKHFESAIDFIFEVVGARPRPLLLYWQECAAHTEFQDYPYKAVLSSEELIKALKRYAEIIANDIALEYDLEYKGLFSLLNFLTSRSENLHRINKRDTFAKVIEEGIAEVLKIDATQNDSKYKWLTSGTPGIMDILYKVGVIGLPVSNKFDRKADWIEATYSSMDPQKMVNAYDHIVIHPVYWSWLTNIKTETLYRRRYSHNLYEQFHDSIMELSTFLQSVSKLSKQDRALQEYTIGKFLSLAQLVIRYQNYPETLDYVLARKVIDQLDKSLYLFSETALCQARIQDSNKRINGMMNFYLETMLASIPSFRRSKIKFNDDAVFQAKKVEYSEDYKKIVPPLLTLDQITPHDLRLLQELDDNLTTGDQCLNKVVVKAMDTWKSLL